MTNVPIPRPLHSPRWWIPLVALFLAAPALAQGYKPGEIIEYRVRGAVPPKWEFGVIIQELDGGKQYLIYEKPITGFPEGPQKAYAPSELRAPQIPKPNPNLTPADPKLPPNRPIRVGAGLLTKQDVIAYAKEVFGSGEPLADPLAELNRRDANRNKIRDFIKARGTNFLPDLDFENNEMPKDTYSNHIRWAIQVNYGKHPRLEDYVGTFMLGDIKRGRKAVTPEGPKIVLAPEDLRYETGVLEIKKDGTYTWVVSVTHPEEQWVRGKWREAKPDEMFPYEGGPAIWLEKAHQLQDYMVRMCREPDYEGWIEFGASKARTSMLYGRRP
jgi:hypothetical protein